jgi:hypothetical protein
MVFRMHTPHSWGYRVEPAEWLNSTYTIVHSTCHGTVICLPSRQLQRCDLNRMIQWPTVRCQEANRVLVERRADFALIAPSSIGTGPLRCAGVPPEIGTATGCRKINVERAMKDGCRSVLDVPTLSCAAPYAAASIYDDLLCCSRDMTN